MTDSIAPPPDRTLIALGRRVYGLPALLTWVIIVFPFLSALIIGLMLWFPSTHHHGERLLAEDHLVENFTVVGYLVGCGLAIALALRLQSRGVGKRLVLGFLCYAVVCFGLAGEEISWGQRIFHFKSPEVMQRENVQHEMTIHNLEIFQDLDSWFPLIFAAAALLAIRLHTRRRRETTGIPSILIPYCWVIVVLAGYDNLTDNYPINLRFDILIGNLRELVEMLFAFALALGVWFTMRRYARQWSGSIPSR
jgi:hypothetical protein